MEAVLDSIDLESNAVSLKDFLQMIGSSGMDMEAIYVQDDAGRTFSKVCLVEDRLTDGSIAYNVVLS